MQDKISLIEKNIQLNIDNQKNDLNNKLIVHISK